jgi:hypothetical protein
MWCKANVLFIGGPFAVIILPIYMHLHNFNLLLYFFQMTCMLGNLGLRSVSVTDIHTYVRHSMDPELSCIDDRMLRKS